MDDRDEICVLDDDMTALYQKILAATALLLATPYYSSPTAQIKLMIDRFFPLGDFQKARRAKAHAGRPVGLACCYADAKAVDGAGFYHAYHILKAMAVRSGGTFSGCVHGTADQKGDMLRRPDLLEAGRTFGARLHDTARAWQEGPRTG